MRFVPAPGAVARLQRDPRYQRLLRSAANDIARTARALAPDGGPHRGYRETLRVATSGDEVRAESTDPFAHLVEFGSRNNPPYAPLRRAVHATGLRLREQPPSVI